jgi:squalene-associated FAD-dependent desaturase
MQARSSEQRRVAVIGGGWGGLAAAVRAAQRGHAVTLFEMAPEPGGRARRVDMDGHSLDNGQHILIGAYTETLRLMRTVGIDARNAFLRTPLCLAGPKGTGFRLPGGPAALSFTRGVLSHKSWLLRDRLALLSAAGGWLLKRFRCPDNLTVAELTAGLPAAIRQELIDPLCVAALNTPSEHASGRVFLRVLRDALFAGPGSADLLLPRMRLSELLPEPAIAWLVNAGAKIRLRCRVEHLLQTDGGWQIEGDRFDHVILATSAKEAARLTRAINPGWADQAAALPYEPIITVYLRSQGTRLPHPMLMLPSDTQNLPAQFVFDHGHLDGLQGLMAFVVSGAQPWVDKGLGETAEATLVQARINLGPYLRAPLEMLRAFTEKRATFRCVPGLTRPPRLVAKGLMAAGDYVEGPYPATLEGAVRSGLQAAEAIG